ncbi:MAG: NTP transferase domain-containing protein [Clostridiales bacterium]|jgi:GTP:adenosylcobinamide-phosphate guanylyltransferase|nr:NTP transferase domain-containing protein [Clostridiales bacterium]
MFDYIIVQAGGKGTRMKHLTANKPKALVPVDNLPMLFHLFRKFPAKKFIIIGDYKFDVLDKYLAAFADVQFITVNANGASGTCGGVGQALEYLPENAPFMLIWCDLVLPDEFSVPNETADYIGLSVGFPSRWKYEDDIFAEECSDTCGVAGLFVFTDKSKIADVPEEGEFVRWLQSKKKTFGVIPLIRTKEFGLIEEYEKLETSRCRPFNRIEQTDDGKLIKWGIDEQGRKLAVREKAWYKMAQDIGVTQIPRIDSFEPFIMEKINGKNIWEYDFTREQRLDILRKLVDTIKELHSKSSAPTDYFSIKNAYVDKTFARIDKIRNLVPLADDGYITVNNRKCHNIYFYRNVLENAFAKYRVPYFKFIHGDNTFCNMMLRNDAVPVFIDPRGYFGFTENYGDPQYDWAKLYYSIVGDYDRFNVKKFTLEICENSVKLDIETNGWRDVEDGFFRLLDGIVNRNEIKLIHAVIWLSLSTYAWEDYDSVCGAFYNGLFYLEESLWGNKNE